MLVFVRPSIFPLTLVLLSCSPLYSLFIHFDTSCILLSSLGLSLAEYARYSRLIYFPFSLCLIGRCSRRWIPGAGVPRRRILRRRVPRRPGVVSEAPSVAPRLRGSERPVHQPRDQVFWSTAHIDIELKSFLLPKIS